MTSSTCNIILSTSWRPHGRYKQHIDYVQFGGVLLVIPVTMINPLSQQLNWGLSTIHLFSWHVQIIYIIENHSIQRAVKYLSMCALILLCLHPLTNINNTLLSNRGAKYTLSPSVQFGHDDVLNLC